MIRFLIDADEFWADLSAAITEADRRVLVQTMSFEGDRAGRLLATALDRCPCVDRRLIVDSFSRVILSGRLALGPAARRPGPVRREVAATHALLRRLQRRGTGVRFCSPLGLLLRRLPARNHKKSIVVDDVAWIGGLNFSDHNFAWHDMMIRIDHPGVAEFLAADFEDTWQGRRRSRSACFPGIDIDVADGRSNGSVFARVLERIDAARGSVVVHSPYLMLPFTRHLARAVQRGVHVTVITPEHNTLPLLKRYMLAVAARSGFDVRIYPDRMSHLKAMLIDDEALIVGSSNFDYLSYRRHEEIVACCTDTAVIAQFRARVLDVDLARCGAHGCSVPATRAERWALHARVHAASQLLTFVSA